MGKTTIEWAQDADGGDGETWPVIRGCSRVSPGCGGGRVRGPNGESGGCYAEGIASRFSWPAQPDHEKEVFHKAGTFHGFAEMRDGKPHWTGHVALVLSELDAPLRKRKPTTYFISMADLFHEKLTNEEIAAVFAVAAIAWKHTFKFLTKRSERMREWFAWISDDPAGKLAAAAEKYLSSWNDEIGCHLANFVNGFARWKKMPDDGVPFDGTERRWPLANVHLGVSVELPEYKSRLDDLRACPAAVRFASFEPLLGDLGVLDLSGIHQAIMGAESGRGARGMDEAWVRGIIHQAGAQGVARFYKQKLDERGHKVSLPLLDGVRYAEHPITRAT